MRAQLYLFAEYERTGGIRLIKRTGKTMAFRARSPLDAADVMARYFILLGRKAELHPRGPTVYPDGADESVTCWQLVETRS